MVSAVSATHFGGSDGLAVANRATKASVRVCAIPAGSAALLSLPQAGWGWPRAIVEVNDQDAAAALGHGRYRAYLRFSQVHF